MSHQKNALGTASTARALQPQHTHQSTRSAGQLQPLDRDRDIERRYLAAVCWLPRHLRTDPLESVRADLFYFPQYRHIFQAIHDLHHAGRSFDDLIIRHRLTERGLLADSGGDQFVIDVLTTETTGLHATEYAAILRDRADMRALVEACEDVLRAADRDGAVSPDLRRRLIETATPRPVFREPSFMKGIPRV